MGDNRCRSCFENAINKLVHSYAIEERHTELIDLILADARSLPSGTPAPLGAALVLERFAALTGIDDPFVEDRQNGNRLVLEAMPALRRLVEAAPEPLPVAVRAAIAGNVLDVAAPNAGSFLETLDRLLEEPLAYDHLEQLREKLASAKTLLYLADNAGEIIADRLLVEQLAIPETTVVVRGRPAWNDALMADAHMAGLDEIAHVINNGHSAPGTILEYVTPEVRRLFAEADIVISKGQGNYETLSTERRPGLFFMLVVKCDVVADTIGAKRRSGVLLHAPEHPAIEPSLGL